MNNIIFPGSFDPLTNGHIDLIKRASVLYDNVTVVVVDGLKKTMFDSNTRVKFVKDVLEDLHLDNVCVKAHKGLIVEYCSKNDIYLMLRGLRNITDLAYEHNMTIHNKLMECKIETVCLLSKPEHFHISSSSVRELILLNKDISHLVHKCIAKNVGDFNETI